MTVKQSDLKKGKNKYAAVTKEGQPFKVSADTEEEAKLKVEGFFNVEVHSVTQMKAWHPGGVRAEKEE